MSKRNGGFEGKVLTHLEYIRKKQDEHDKKIETIINNNLLQKDSCYHRFDKINKRIDTAEGFAKGAMAVGGLGFLGGFFNIISKIFGGN